ncbi:GAF domain-containing protein [Bordetella genomosp. 13]|uniref:GAF domain-containing protein n=1 Tax=Bordetella genomosp. 13 TaxID=463040 RepID=UPI0011A9912F|nr:GAF domain-containing protein [Bordetella genomosp. 13]
MPRPAPTPLLSLARALAQGADDDVVWQCLDRTLAESYGHGLFTLLAYNRSAGVMQRLYSSRPDINPVGGMKRVTQSAWVDSVLVRGEGYLGSSADDIRAVFSDHALLLSHGLQSVLNVSVRLDGEVLGSLNLLHGAAHYDALDVSQASVAAQLIAPRLRRRVDTLSADASVEGLESV